MTVMNARPFGPGPFSAGVRTATHPSAGPFASALMNILLVDLDEMILRSIGDFLTLRSHRVKTA